MQSEQKTIRAMIGIYCKHHHAADSELCPECLGLLEYARAKLAKCPHGVAKPVCAKCPIHCYRPEKREEIRSVMRFAGPRMVFRHPLLTLAHLLQKRRPAPATSRAARECSAVQSQPITPTQPSDAQP